MVPTVEINVSQFIRSWNTEIGPLPTLDQKYSNTENCKYVQCNVFIWSFAGLQCVIFIWYFVEWQCIVLFELLWSGNVSFYLISSEVTSLFVYSCTLHSPLRGMLPYWRFLPWAGNKRQHIFALNFNSKMHIFHPFTKM